MGNLQESQGPTSESTNGAGQYDRRYRPLGHGMGVHHECCIKRILKNELVLLPIQGKSPSVFQVPKLICVLTLPFKIFVVHLMSKKSFVSIGDQSGKKSLGLTMTL